MQEVIGVGRIERKFACPCVGYRLGGHTEMDDLGPSFRMGIILLRSFSVKEESQAYASAFPNELQIQFCSFFPVVEILGASGNSFSTERKAMRSWQVIRRLVFESLGTLFR